MMVAAGPAEDSTVSGLSRLMRQWHPIATSAPSSPGSAKSPSPLISPYRPGPTTRASPSFACAVACPMDRQGWESPLQVESSLPSAATYSTLAWVGSVGASSKRQRKQNETVRVWCCVVICSILLLLEEGFQLSQSCFLLLL